MFQILLFLAALSFGCGSDKSDSKKPPTTQTADGSTTCTYSVNGTVYQGTNQAECDRLKEDLRL